MPCYLQPHPTPPLLLAPSLRSITSRPPSFLRLHTALFLCASEAPGLSPDHGGTQFAPRVAEGAPASEGSFFMSSLVCLSVIVGRCW